MPAIRAAVVVFCALCGLSLAVSPAPAQEPAPAPGGTPAPAAPSLRIVSADLRQIGDDLRLLLRFSRDVPSGQIMPGKGRYMCLVLGPDVPTRRRVCVNRRSGGGLRASLTRLDAGGRPRGRVRRLARATVRVDGARLLLRARLDALAVKPGSPISWRAFVTWHDGGPCEAAPQASRCTQTVPETAANELRIARGGGRSSRARAACCCSRQATR